MKLHGSRFWCLFISSVTFFGAQIVGIALENPHFLIVLSLSTGCKTRARKGLRNLVTNAQPVAYGVLFGVGPSLVAETFGVNGLSQNWGVMMTGPIIFGNIFNVLYGRIYDQHSQKRQSGHLECLQGLNCYRDAYWATFGASVLGMVVILWCIHRRHVAQKRVKARGQDLDEDHVA